MAKSTTVVTRDPEARAKIIVESLSFAKAILLNPIIELIGGFVVTEYLQRNPFPFAYKRQFMGGAGGSWGPGGWEVWEGSSGSRWVPDDAPGLPGVSPQIVEAGIVMAVLAQQMGPERAGELFKTVIQAGVDVAKLPVELLGGLAGLLR